MGFLVNSFIDFPTEPFVPTDISELKGWWDASDSDTITKDGSNRVSQWDDKAGTYDWVQATGGKQPLWKSSDQNSLDTIDFSGSRYMTVTGETLTQPTTYCMALLLPNNDSTVDVIYRFGLAAYNIFRKTATDDQFESVNTTALSFTETGLADTWKSTACTANGASSSLLMNNTSKASGDSGTVSANNSWWLSVNANNFNGWGDTTFGELIVYEKLLDSAELASVNTYLVNKWGIS